MKGKVKDLSEKFEHSKAYDDDISDTKKREEDDEKIKTVADKFGERPKDKKKKRKLAKEKAKKEKKEKKKKKKEEKKRKKEKTEEKEEEKEEEPEEEKQEHKPRRREIRIKAASTKEEPAAEQPVKITHPIKTGFLFGLGLLFFVILLIILLFSISIITGRTVTQLINALI